MAVSSEDCMIMEEREELIKPSSGSGFLTSRIAHFLKPSATSLDGSYFDLRKESSPFLFDSNSMSKYQLVRTAFKGWKNPLLNWNKWVDRMHFLHQSVWKEAGIHDAILNSTYVIKCDDDLLLGFVERWSPKTNTFVFPWCEATITLEDVAILGGYCVLGDSLLTPLGDKQSLRIEEKLTQARQDVLRGKAKKASLYEWKSRFMHSGSKIEHEAFLATWLSRFVFQLNASDTVRKDVIHIAVHLSKGTKIALAPAVLAGIYMNLSQLKLKMIACEKMTYEDNVKGIWSPLQLVQIWIWERFLTFHPRPNPTKCGEPRLARWHGLKTVKIGNNMTLAIKNAEKHFLWRPYAADVNIVSFHKFYEDKDEWVRIDSSLEEDIEVFARCLRPSELVGLEENCIEQYLPHRVAMQFGFDQDCPGQVPRANASPDIAWKNYTRPIGDTRLYIPSRLFVPGVTARYVSWWKQLWYVGIIKEEKSVEREPVIEKNAIEKRTESSKSLKRKLIIDEHQTNADNDALFPPGFSADDCNLKSGVSVNENKVALTELVKYFQTKNVENKPPSAAADIEENELVLTSVKPVKDTNQRDSTVGEPVEEAMGDSIKSGVKTMVENTESSSKRESNHHIAPAVTQQEFRFIQLFESGLRQTLVKPVKDTNQRDSTVGGHVKAMRDSIKGGVKTMAENMESSSKRESNNHLGPAVTKPEISVIKLENSGLMQTSVKPMKDTNQSDSIVVEPVQAMRDSVKSSANTMVGNIESSNKRESNHHLGPAVTQPELRVSRLKDSGLMQASVKQVKDTNQSDSTVREPAQSMRDSIKSDAKTVVENVENSSNRESNNYLGPAVTQLEFRVSKLEKLVTQIKAAKLANID